MSGEPAALSPGKRLVFALMLVLGVPVAAFVLVEGGSSLLVLTSDLLRGGSGRLHGITFMSYDSLLGWVSRAGVSLPDHYGPGAHLHTNTLGHRGRRAVEPRAAAGRVRLVCSGDSFAFGVRVGDDATWCSRLALREPRLETINLGQEAYGTDQAYLRYMRDGAPLAPSLHVFTFIWDDLYRMQLDAKWGYPKPTLALVDGRLRAGNVPVPRGAYFRPWLTARLQGAGGAVRGLRAVELTRRVRAWLAPAGTRWTERGLVSDAADSATWRIAAALLEDLAREAEGRGAGLVVVHLPSGDDERYRSTPWRGLAWETAAAQGLHYLDLADALAELPAGRRDSIFIPGDPHFSATGHDWAAGEILAFVRRTPALAALLEAGDRP